MATKTSIVCDVCGKVKGETNDWFLAAESDDEDGKAFSVITAGSIKREQVVEGAKDACGQACATVLFNQWMSRKTDQPNEESKS